MARRQSKAASRRARQRRLQRPAQPAPASVARPTVDEAPPAQQRVEEPAPRRVSAPSAARAFSTSSSLTDRERAEYHYVERDLRNIGILTALLIGLLLAAWAVFNALGIVG